MSKYLQRARVPKLYWGEGALEEQISSEIVTGYLNELPRMVSEGQGLLLWGDHGSGKTAIACVALKKIIEAAKTALFVRFDKIAEYYVESTRFDEYESYVHRMEEAELLVIDELIHDKTRIYSLGRVEQLLRYRTSELKPTILTTNMPLSQLEKQAKGLYEACREATYPVKIGGKDFRAERVTRMSKRLGIH